MALTKSQNLVPVLDTLQAVYRSSAGQPPEAGRDGAAQRAASLASGVRLGLDDPQALRRLRRVIWGLGDAPRLDALLPRVLDGALSLMGADFGTMRLLDPVSGSLWLVTYCGFGPEFLDYFAVVDGGLFAPWTGGQPGAQAVVADVDADPGFAPYRDVAAAVGFRAMVSTALADDAGRLVGVVSAHFTRPHRPAAQDLQMIALYGDVAGQAAARSLGVAAGDGPGEVISRAVISALLGPEAPSGDDPMPRFADHVVNRLFAVGLSLESARSIAGPGPVDDRLAAATGEIDLLIRYIRTATFGLATGPAGAAGEPPGPVADSLFDIRPGLGGRG